MCHIFQYKFNFALILQAYFKCIYPLFCSHHSTHPKAIAKDTGNLTDTNGTLLMTERGTVHHVMVPDISTKTLILRELKKDLRKVCFFVVLIYSYPTLHLHSTVVRLLNRLTTYLLIILNLLFGSIFNITWIFFITLVSIIYIALFLIY